MEIRNYITGDEVHIIKLFQQVFGKTIPEAYWKWRFIDNPENKVMIKLMWDDAELVGHYAVSPSRLLVDDERILTALSMTTMTHPSYTGRNIFTDLAEDLYRDESKKNDLKGVWGFPNNNSHYGFIKKLNWRNLEQIPTLSIPVSKLKSVDYSRVSTITSFTEKHIITHNKLTQNYRIKTEKHIPYLTWRYLENPINNYSIFELADGDNRYFAVVKPFNSFTQKGSFEIDFLEFAFPNNYEMILSLLNAVKNYYKEKTIVAVNIWLPFNDNRHLSLEKMGFVNSLPITYSGIRILDSKYKHLENPSDWFYSMADSDIY